MRGTRMGTRSSNLVSANPLQERYTNESRIPHTCTPHSLAQSQEGYEERYEDLLIST